jgi:hypothetical protein
LLSVSFSIGIRSQAAVSSQSSGNTLGKFQSSEIRIKNSRQIQMAVYIYETGGYSFLIRIYNNIRIKGCNFLFDSFSGKGCINFFYKGYPVILYQ